MLVYRRSYTDKVPYVEGKRSGRKKKYHSVKCREQKMLKKKEIT